MKAKLTLLVIILSFAFVGQVVAQAPYVPIRANNFWSIEFEKACRFPTGPNCINRVVAIGTTKDTLILGRGVYIKYSEYGYDTVNRVIFTGSPYVEFFRNDLINRRVYFIFDMASPKDSLLYDFNVTHIGDSTLSSDFSLGDRLILVALDSIVVNGRVHRIQSLAFSQQGLPIKQIEGIGCQSGLFPLHIGPDTPSLSLICYNSTTINQTTIRNVPCDSAAMVVLKLQTSEQGLNEAIIAFPNPQLVGQEFQLTYQNLNLQDQLLKVYDVLGKDVADSFTLTPTGGIAMHKPGVFYIRHPRVAGVTRIVAL